MRSLLVLILLLALSACGLARIKEQKEQFARLNDQLVGKTYDDLLKTRGVPIREASLSTGGKVVVYEKSETTMSGGGSLTVPSSAYVANPYGGGTWVHGTQQRALPVRSHTWSCALTFIISPASVVESWKAEGNACY
jgi:hypothetical protein